MIEPKIKHLLYVDNNYWTLYTDTPLIGEHLLNKPYVINCSSNHGPYYFTVDPRYDEAEIIHDLEMRFHDMKVVRVKE